MQEKIINIATRLAKFGHDVRIERLDVLKNTNDYVKELCELHETIIATGARSEIVNILATIRHPLDILDTITLADILEYELLNELERLMGVV